MNIDNFTKLMNWFKGTVLLILSILACTVYPLTLHLGRNDNDVLVFPLKTDHFELKVVRTYCN